MAKNPVLSLVGLGAKDVEAQLIPSDRKAADRNPQDGFDKLEQVVEAEVDFVAAQAAGQIH